MTKRLREAKTRAGMRQVSAWIPETLHRRLALARVHDHIATNEAIREAIRLWLAKRAAARRRKKP